MYQQKRGARQVALVTLATQDQETLLCEILYGDKHGIQIQLYDPEKENFDSWVFTYPARAIVSVMQPPASMTTEEFVAGCKVRPKLNGDAPKIERGN